MIDLIRNMFRNPMTTWSIATVGERAALIFLIGVLLADILRFALIDIALDVAMILLMMAFIWDDLGWTDDEDQNE